MTNVEPCSQGGAPVQQSLADEIRANGFALNAAAAVTVAQEVDRG